MLSKHGIDCCGHHARQMTRGDYDRYDYIIGMDRENLRNICRIAGSDPMGKVSLLLDHTARSGQEVADPWYTGNFEETWQDVWDGCTGLLAEMEG
jgi:protein-tyrosine phosphatase